VELRSDEAAYLHPERIESPSLQSVLALIQTIGGGSDETLAERVLDRFFEVVPAERGAIVVGPYPEELEPLAMRGGSGGKGRFSLSRTVLDRVFAEKTGVLSNHVRSELSAKSLVASNVEGLISLPLLTGGRMARFTRPLYAGHGVPTEPAELHGLEHLPRAPSTGHASWRPGLG
jgi:hypothetical protein